MQITVQRSVFDDGCLVIQEASVERQRRAGSMWCSMKPGQRVYINIIHYCLAICRPAMLRSEAAGHNLPRAFMRRCQKMETSAEDVEME